MFITGSALLIHLLKLVTLKVTLSVIDRHPLIHSAYADLLSGI